MHDGEDGVLAHAAICRSGSICNSNHGGVAVLFELTRDDGIEVRERRLCPVDGRQMVAGLPLACAYEVEARAGVDTRMIAHRKLAHALQDIELDLRDLG